MRKLWNTLKVGVDNADIYYIMGYGKRIPCIKMLHEAKSPTDKMGNIGGLGKLIHWGGERRGWSQQDQSVVTRSQ